MQMCAAFATNRMDVKLVARAPEDDQLTAAALQHHYGVPKNFEVEQFTLSDGFRASERFQLRALWKERHETNLCYSRGRDVTAPLLALALGASAVVEIHGHPTSLREQLMLRAIQAHPRGFLTANSQNLRSFCINSFRMRPERFFVASNGVDLARYTPPMLQKTARTICGLSADQCYVVYTGGLYDGRGLDTLFTAIRDTPVKLLLVGGRTQEEITTWQDKALAMDAKNVCFTGYQPPMRVPLYLAAADMLAMPYSNKVISPSGEDTTNIMSPLKMFEYMAAARPIVATDLPMIREVLKDQHNALLVPPGDASTLRAALQRLAAMPELGRMLAANARADVAQHTWEARARHILANVGVN